MGRGLEAPHVRLTPSERDERPISAMDFAVRKGRADDGGADDDMWTFQAIVDSSTVCTPATASEKIKEPQITFSSSVASIVKKFFG